MAAAPPGLFRPAAHGHKVATLVLIENSPAMVDRWPDLRDRYLPTLLGTMRMANPVVPIQVLWLTSTPVSPGDDAAATPNSSRQYNQLPEVRFTAQPNNKITAATLFHVADLLAKTFPDSPTTRHLFVVAASGPSENTEVPGLPADRHVWQALGAKLTQENIHLHMILNSHFPESAGFVQLFYDILAMQGFCEATPWFPAADPYRFFLSMRADTAGRPPPPPPPAGASPPRLPLAYMPPPAPTPTSPTLLTPSSALAGLSLASPPSRAPLPRNHSFPPPGPPRPPSPQQSADAEPKPSLVKHLQKIHGLTKKRNYGLQAPRPFIRDDPHALALADAARPRRNTGVHASRSRTVGLGPLRAVADRHRGRRRRRGVPRRRARLCERAAPARPAAVLARQRERERARDARARAVRGAAPVAAAVAVRRVARHVCVACACAAAAAPACGRRGQAVHLLPRVRGRAAAAAAVRAAAHTCAHTFAAAAAAAATTTTTTTTTGGVLVARERGLLAHPEPGGVPGPAAREPACGVRRRGRGARVCDAGAGAGLVGGVLRARRRRCSLWSVLLVLFSGAWACVCCRDTPRMCA
ncbi:hypothetical protein BC834DRAFT_305279 [Gloeopeniophorella convolvens]|nr:hypothetical protein BC834DRAFT_305279 [Gloeopeniophorella convolvens]